eukprot:CAMPEP_0180694794 /NCGR_PEP_ID=MMETSP1038_2-20121128/2108_1 /TAXON_ID=632150 /ORGANISM="Azadinium spinosum, Strain 3D9" /LENGTH=91 /DNA_ID=CAMNT_0022726175 /DNA_START=348 /DNA_END=624 /DNA_ORIENTATION=+
MTSMPLSVESFPSALAITRLGMKSSSATSPPRNLGRTAGSGQFTHPLNCLKNWHCLYLLGDPDRQHRAQCMQDGMYAHGALVNSTGPNMPG